MAVGGGTKRIMRKLRIDEISGVDVPAQEGARALIIKRDARPGEPVDKSGLVNLVTGSANGHAHGITVRRYREGELNIWVEHAQAEADDSGHSHSLMMTPEGAYAVVENAGHTHTLDSAALAAAIVGTVNKEAEMTPEEKARLEKLEKQLARGSKIIALAADLRTHFDGLADEALQDAFLAKSADEQKAEVKKVADEAAAAEAARNAEDPVVHKTKTGIEIRKSDGATMLAMAKEQDKKDAENAELRKTVKDLTDQTGKASYEKRAREELPDVPGSVEARAAMLKAIDGIEDEAHRKAALAALKSKGDGISKLFKSIGTADPGADDATGGDDPSDKLEALAKAYQKDHPELSYEQAEARVLETPEGSELYTGIADRGTHVISDVAA